MNDRRVNYVYCYATTVTQVHTKRQKKTRIHRSARPLHSTFGYMNVMPERSCHCDSSTSIQLSHDATRLYFNIPFLLCFFSFFFFFVSLNFVIRSRRLGILYKDRHVHYTNTHKNHENGAKMNQVHAEVDVIVCLLCFACTKKSDDFLRFLSCLQTYYLHRHTNSGGEKERRKRKKKNKHSEHSIA